MTSTTTTETQTTTTTTTTETWNLNPANVATVVLAATYWIAAIVWPEDWDPKDEWRLVLGVIAAVVLVAGIWGLVKGDATIKAYSALAFFVAVLLGVAAVGTFDFGLAGDNRVAIGVGGLAVAGLLFGVIRYDTVRAAASITVVILTIGVLTFPGAQDLVGETNVGEIMIWMGIVLGVNGGSEALVQWQKIRATAEAESDEDRAAIREVQGDFQRAT